MRYFNQDDIKRNVLFLYKGTDATEKSNLF